VDDLRAVTCGASIPNGETMVMSRAERAALREEVMRWWFQPDDDNLAGLEQCAAALGPNVGYLRKAGVNIDAT
jgi:hypothetical protein